MKPGRVGAGGIEHCLVIKIEIGTAILADRSASVVFRTRRGPDDQWRLRVRERFPRRFSIWR